MSITKKDAINVVAVENAISKKDAEAAIDSFIGLINQAVIDGEKFTIKGFGTFFRGVRKARKCTTKIGPVDVPDRYSMRFKPSAATKAELRKIEVEV